MTGTDRACGPDSDATFDSQQGGNCERTKLHCNACLFDAASDGGSVVLLITNFSLPQCTPAVWRTSCLRVVADGGANRLFDELPPLVPGQSPEQTRTEFVPDVIAGDMDSARNDVLTHYTALGVPVMNLSEDQDTTDLTKCVRLARRLAQEKCLPSPVRFVAVGSLGGRLDHQLAALSTLHAHLDLDVVLLGAEGTAKVLSAGRHSIRPLSSFEGPVCGLVPLAGPAHVTTRGLRWDMNATRLAMGHLVSTSNQLADAEVVVTTDAPLVWVTELRRDCAPRD